MFALNAAVPLLDGGVDVGLCDRSGRLGPLRHLRRDLLGRWLHNGLRRGLFRGNLLFCQQTNLRPGQPGLGSRVADAALPHMELVREALKADGGPILSWILMWNLTKPQAQVAGPQRFLRVVREELDQGLPGGRPILVAQDFREILPVEGRRGDRVWRGQRRSRRRSVQGQLLRAVGRRICHTGYRLGQRLSPLLELPHNGVPAFFFRWCEIVLAGDQLLQPGGGPAPGNVYAAAGGIPPKLNILRGINDSPVAAVLIGLAVCVVRAIFLFQKGHGGPGIRHPQVHGVNAQLAVLSAGPAPQLHIPFLTRDGKSGGRLYALRFQNGFPLLPLCGEQTELPGLFG